MDKDKRDIQNLCDFIEDDETLIRNIACEPLEDVHSFLKEKDIESLEVISAVRHRVRARTWNSKAVLQQLRHIISLFGSRPALSFSLTIVIAMIGLQFYFPEQPQSDQDRGITPIAVDPSIDESAEELENLYAQIMALYQKDEFHQAEPLVQQVLATIKDIHGDEHPDTAGALNNLAVVKKNLGKFDEATEYYEQALSIQDKRLGKTHPVTLTTRENLGLLYEEIGKYKLAENIYQEIFETHKIEFGTTDPRTIESRNNLIEFYQKFGKDF